jgi:hypothetical protein
MTVKRSSARRIRAAAGLLMAFIVPLALHGCPGAGPSNATLAVKTKRDMGVAATGQYSFAINYFGQGPTPTGTGCAGSYTKTVSVQGTTTVQGHAYDDTTILNLCPGSWSISVGIGTWSGQCQQTLTVGNNSAHFTYEKPGCNPTAYP